MIQPGYNPHFFAQEWVKELFSVRFPNVSVNDIQPYYFSKERFYDDGSDITFRNINPNEYFLGYVSFTVANVDYLLNLNGTQVAHVAGGFTACSVPFLFNDITCLGLRDVNDSPHFVGWRIMADNIPATSGYAPASNTIGQLTGAIPFFDSTSANSIGSPTSYTKIWGTSTHVKFLGTAYAFTSGSVALNSVPPNAMTGVQNWYPCDSGGTLGTNDIHIDITGDRYRNYHLGLTSLSTYTEIIVDRPGSFEVIVQTFALGSWTDTADISAQHSGTLSPGTYSYNIISYPGTNRRLKIKPTEVESFGSYTCPFYFFENLYE